MRVRFACSAAFGDHILYHSSGCSHHDRIGRCRSNENLGSADARRAVCPWQIEGGVPVKDFSAFKTISLMVGTTPRRPLRRRLAAVGQSVSRLIGRYSVDPGASNQLVTLPGNTFLYPTAHLFDMGQSLGKKAETSSRHHWPLNTFHVGLDKQEIR